MALWSTGGTSIPDIFISAYLFTVMLISIILNSFVCYWNHKRPESIAVLLFKTLAITDLLSNIILPINSIRIILPQGEPRCISRGQDFICSAKENITRHDTIPTIIGYPLIILSPGITAIMAVCRYIHVIKPFIIIKIIVVKFTIGIIIGLTYGYMMVIFLAHSIENIQYSYVRQAAILTTDNAVILFVLGISPYLLFEIAGMLTSILTVIYLRNRKRQKNSRRITKKVILMNLNGICGFTALMIVLIITVNAGDEIHRISMANEILVFTSYIIVPSLISVLNPIIFIILTTNAINFAKKPCVISHVITYSISPNRINSIKRTSVISHVIPNPKSHNRINSAKRTSGTSHNIPYPKSPNRINSAKRTSVASHVIPNPTSPNRSNSAKKASVTSHDIRYSTSRKRINSVKRTSVTSHNIPYSTSPNRINSAKRTSGTSHNIPYSTSPNRINSAKRTSVASHVIPNPTSPNRSNSAKKDFRYKS